MDALGLHLTRHGARAVLMGASGDVVASSRVEGDRTGAVQQVVRGAARDRAASVVGVAADASDDIDIGAATRPSRISRLPSTRR